MLCVLLRSRLHLSQTFNCGSGSGRGCWGGSSSCCCELGGWESGQVLIPSPGPWGPANCHLFLLTLHTWGSRRCCHAPPTPHLHYTLPLTSSPALHPTALLTLYSSQRLSIHVWWSIDLTRSTSTLASASLITSSLHGWVFKDNWAQEPASLWVTVGRNDNQLDPVQVQFQ